MLDKIPRNTRVDDINLDAAEYAVICKLDTEYADEKEIYKSVEYSNFQYQLTTLDDGRRALLCQVDVYLYLEMANGVDGRTGEHVSLVILLPE